MIKSSIQTTLSFSNYQNKRKTHFKRKNTSKVQIIGTVKTLNFTRP